MFLSSEFSAISEDFFKCLTFLSFLQELCQSDVLRRIFRITEENDKLASEDLTNESMKRTTNVTVT